MKSPLRSVRATDVVARTDLTTGAFYHHWSSQDDYREGLLAHLGEKWDPASAARRFHGTVGVPTQHQSILELFLAEIDSVAADPSWWVEVAMLCSAEPAEVAHVHRHMHDWVEGMAALYADVLAAFGLELRSECSHEMLARSVMALVDGFSLQLRAGFELEGADTSAREWGSVEWSIASVICAMVDDHEAIDDRGDLRAKWSRLFGID